METDLDRAGKLINEQRMYEAEGEEAAEKGLARKDCPYDKEVDAFKWNHWVYGCENRRAKLIWRMPRI